MKITNLHDFLQAYFTAHYCKIIHNDDGIMTVQLTEELDRALMNRPFYWHYIKSTGNAGDPMQLTLITNPVRRDEKGEWIHFGSPRLQQIFNHLKETSENIKLFQKVDTTNNTAMYPWLITNIKINYEGKQNRNELFSIGLNLVNGKINTNMMGLLELHPLNITISDYCYPISPLIRLNSGFIRIEKIIENHIKNQSHEWATESLETLAEEVELVKHFYESDNEEIQIDNEINDLTKRFTPFISYQVINGGIVYLTQDTA